MKNATTSQMNRMTLLPMAAMVLFACGASEPVDAQELAPNAMKQIASLINEKRSRTPAQKKLDSHLLYYLKMSRGEAISPEVPRIPAVLQSVKVTNGMVLVDIRTDGSIQVASDLTGLGAAIVWSYPEYRAIRANLPLAKLESAAAVKGVRRIDRPAVPVSSQSVGTVDVAGDVAHQANVLRNRPDLQFTGAGVKVGVISTGVDSLAAQKLAGFLPNSVTVLTGQSGQGDEGTAMLEIVHALAPGAQLFFATGFDGMQSMANNITALADVGCTIIVDDLSYMNEAVFQDDVIARAVSAVMARGVSYFTSASNDGNKNAGLSGTWEGDFTKSGVTIPGLPVNATAQIHTFGASITNTLTTSRHNDVDALGNTFVTSYPFGVSLKWADPLGASTNDYDLFILDASLTNVVDLSVNVQDGDQDPIETTGPSNRDMGEQVVIVLTSGEPRALHLATPRHGLSAGLSINTNGAIYGHAAGSAAAVAAVNVANAGGGAFSGAPSVKVEMFSSDGPRRFFFDANGQDLTPGNHLFTSNGGRVVQKPDFSAADGVTTSVTGFNPFFGTSAAAPHAAAVAALVKSAYPGFLVGADMTEHLRRTALDIEASGADQDSGAGIVMALNAVSVPPAIRIVSPSPGASIPAGSDVIITASATDAVTGADLSGQIVWPGHWATDTQLVTGRQLTIPAYIPPGPLTVTASITIHGVTSTATVTVTIQDYPTTVNAPLCYQGDRNGPTLLSGVPITCTATAKKGPQDVSTSIAWSVVNGNSTSYWGTGRSAALPAQNIPAGLSQLSVQVVASIPSAHASASLNLVIVAGFPPVVTITNASQQCRALCNGLVHAHLVGANAGGAPIYQADMLSLAGSAVDDHNLAIPPSGLSWYMQSAAGSGFAQGASYTGSLQFVIPQTSPATGTTTNPFLLPIVLKAVDGRGLSGTATATLKVVTQ